MAYSFTIVVKDAINDTNINIVRAVYSGKTCLIAKNAKHGELYIHKMGKIIKGSFERVSGSHTYPTLRPKKEEVHVRFENFPMPPNISTDIDEGVLHETVLVIDVTSS